MKNKSIYITLTIGVIILVVLIFISQSLSPKTPTTNISPTPNTATRASQKSYKQITTVPTLAPRQGAGVDIKSAPVQASQVEIQKLSPYLPLNKEITLSTGQTVTLSIPELKYQIHNWILTVYIFDIDYNAPTNTPEYTENKKIFLEAASQMFSWMNSHNVDSKRILIQWDDKEYIQNRAEEWLR